MPMDAHDIESMIKAAIPDADVTIRDLAGDGDHYAATVISESFRGKSRVQQHQIVYQSLKGQMGGVLHARLAAEGFRDHGRRIVVAIAGQIPDRHLGVGNRSLDHRFDIVGVHRHPACLRQVFRITAGSRDRERRT